MDQKPLLAFAIALILASTGCLGFGDDELEQQENDNNEKQEPVGETNMTSLEKRIEHLESTIAEYEQPRVYFLNVSGYSYTSPSLEYHLSDDGYLLCTYYEYYERMMCSINVLYYDANGLVTSYSWEGSEAELENLTIGGLCQADTKPIICRTTAGSTSSHWTDVCKFGEVNQRLTLTVYDNDGNSASASYDLDYDSACTVVEPDNTCASDSDCPPGTICQGGVCVEDNLNVCEDGEQSEVGGMIRTCSEGSWGHGQSIICGWNYNVTNNVCVPCPEGSVNEAGDDASSADTTCDTNHPPVIDNLSFAGEFVTNETDYVCLDFNIYDVDGDEIDGTATWLINGVSAESLPIDECFYFAEYDEGTDYEIGDELSVTIIVWDGEYEATATITTIIEEESE